MSMPKFIFLFLLSLQSAGAVNATVSDHEAIFSLMNRAFEAVGSGDPADMRAIQLAKGTSLSFRPRVGGKPGELEMRMATNEALTANAVDNGREYMERWVAEPTVMIRGPIAVVWGEYEFWIDGEFSHCGIDSVDLVMVGGEWKIANWLWTVEKDGCATDPSTQN